MAYLKPALNREHSCPPGLLQKPVYRVDAITVSRARARGNRYCTREMGAGYRETVQNYGRNFQARFVCARESGDRCGKIGCCIKMGHGAIN